jgi:acyl dehydratase
LEESVRETVMARLGAAAVSEWVQILQATIDTFADATGDHQFIHVDPVAAAASPFGGTIAHGFLTLSLLPHLISTAPGLFPSAPASMAVNYGCNRLRFLAPVPAGSRVRAHFKVVDIVEKAPGQFQQTTECTVEIEGGAKPALVAEWIIQIHL